MAGRVSISCRLFIRTALTAATTQPAPEPSRARVNRIKIPSAAGGGMVLDDIEVTHMKVCPPNALVSDRASSRQGAANLRFGPCRTGWKSVCTTTARRPLRSASSGW